MTSRTSAPTASHRPATALTKLSLVARKALEAYLMVSAVAASVISSGAWVPANRSPTLAAAAWSSAPTTMRSGCRLSGTAVPSRRNSGLDTTVTSWRPRTRSTTRVEPTGTVDLLTMIVPGNRWGPISSATASTKERSAEPSSPCGVGTHRKTNSAPSTASVAPTTNRSRPAAWPSRTSSSRWSSTMGTRPWSSMATLAGSASPQVTRWPRWARVAAVGSPT